MVELSFANQNKVRAASFAGIGRASPGASGGRRIPLKAVLDVVVARIAIAVSAPLMSRAAPAIKLESLGPIIFRRQRIGHSGSIFEVWKFRSMHAGRPDPDAARQTRKDDPRVTPRVVRRASIDALPQLLNVIRGRMTVAGRRAHAPDRRVEERFLEELLEGDAARRRDKPGITGWAHINGDCAANSLRLKQRAGRGIKYNEK
ncbi:MAG: sugar transferase [Methylocella sp.]